MPRGSRVALPYLAYMDLYGYVPLNRLWFSGSLVLNRVYNIIIISLFSVFNRVSF